ncbi:MAG: restriction endonuclease subunit S [Candidatus Thiodiazotropha endolucinida]
MSRVTSNLPWVEDTLPTVTTVSTGKVDANHAQENGKYTFFTCAISTLKSPTYSFEGDLVILPGNGANVGHVDFYRGKIEAYQRTYVLHNTKIYPKYVYYHLKSHWEKSTIGKQYGSATNYIKMTNFSEYRIPIPPLAEQKQIAAKLDELLAQVDTIKTRLDAILAILKRFRQSVLAAAASGRLTEGWRDFEDFGEKVSIGEIAIDIRYGTSKKCNYESGKTPVLRIPNIGDGHLDLVDLKFAEFEEKEQKKLTLKEGDLLLIRSNGSVDLVGKVAVVTPNDTHCLFAGYLIRLRIDEAHAYAKYILYCLQSPQTRKVIEIQARSTSGVNNINSNELAALTLFLPSIEEQTEIVHRAEQLFSFADQIEQRAKDAQTRVNHLTQSILAKAFRGELTTEWRVQNQGLISDENSAQALLERIKSEQANLKLKKKGRKKSAA